MADVIFNTKENQTIDRNLLILYLNTGTAEAPVWSAVGKRVSDSAMEYDWGEESNTDIFGDTYTTMSKPKITQSFDPWELDAGDKAQLKVWQNSIRNHDTNAMTEARRTVTRTETFFICFALQRKIRKISAKRLSS